MSHSSSSLSDNQPRRGCISQGCRTRLLWVMAPRGRGTRLLVATLKGLRPKVAVTPHRYAALLIIRVRQAQPRSRSSHPR